MAILDISFWQLLVNQFKNTGTFEWLGLLTTLICIYLATKENIWNWPVAVISIVISAIIYFENSLYGDFALQFYFLFTAFYGWWFWLNKKTEKHKPIISLTAKQWLQTVVAIIVLAGLLGLFLAKFTNTNVAYADGFCTAVSFVAQLMLTRKILQNWLLWIIVDICYVPLLIYKNLNLYAILYAILVLIAIKGYLDWKKTYHDQAY